MKKIVQIFVLSFFIGSCSVQEKIKCSPSALELNIKSELANIAMFSKYIERVRIDESLNIDGVSLCYVKAFKRGGNCYLDFKLLKFKDNIIVNLYKLDDEIVDSLGYEKLLISLSRFENMNNDTIDKIVDRVKEGVRNIRKDTRKHYYKP